MDDRDKMLLTLLRRDARASVVALARDLGLSRSATQERLARLVASGAVAGFTIVERPGEGALQSAYLMLAFAPGIRCAQIVPKLKRMAAVAMIHSVTGPTDLIVRIDGRGVADFETCRAAIAELPGIADVSTAVVLERHLG
jgi:DNA-binding Lrp family transcriptional regulator